LSSVGLSSGAKAGREVDFRALRNLSGAFQLFGDDVDKKIRALSCGEKSRLAIARMLYNPPKLSGALLTYQSPGSCGQGDAGGTP
jgi:ABC-type lipoprotein export system ATPase subunit